MKDSVFHIIAKVQLHATSHIARGRWKIGNAKLASNLLPEMLGDPRFLSVEQFISRVIVRLI